MAVQLSKSNAGSDAAAQKTFVFLYPQADIIDCELRKGSITLKVWPREKEFAARTERVTSEEGMKMLRKEATDDMTREFSKIYGPMLNASIDARYRQQGYSVFFALLDGTNISDIIDVRPVDRIIYVGMDEKTHRTKGKDGKYPYPDQDYILNQLGTISKLRIGGFHMWDCVEKLARQAYKRNLDVLVDEDLTEFFGWMIGKADFRVDRYPNYDPRSGGQRELEWFMDARKGKPWLWQDY
jgi:hypothetical protein